MLRPLGSTPARVLGNAPLHFDDILDMPPNAASVEIGFEGVLDNDAAVIEIAKLKFLMNQQAKISPMGEAVLKQYWTGAWIWESGHDPISPVYFRRTFQIPSGAKIKDAKIIITADNEYTLYLNGARLPSGPYYNEWREADSYDISIRLKDGVNVIAVEGVNLDGPAGLLAECGITYVNGDNTFITTDQAWKCSGRHENNWAAPDFDDATWENAFVLGVPPVAPWGDRMSYPSYNGPVNKYTIKKTDAAKTIHAGDRLPIKIVLACDKINLADAKFTIHLEANKFLLVNRELHGLATGGDLTIKENIAIPRYLAPGGYAIIATLANSEINGTATCKTNGNSIRIPFELVDETVAAPIPECRVDLDNATPLFKINGKPYVTMHFLSNLFREHVTNFKEAGLHINFLEDSNYRYDRDGNIDFSNIDEKCIKALSIDKDAYFVLTVTLDNIYNPCLKDWPAKHPDEVVVTSDGATKIKIYGDEQISEVPSMASTVWRDLAEDFSRQLVRHLGKTRYGERVIGIMPWSGVTYEWQYWGSLEAEKVFVDYSKPYKRAFQKYCASKYGSIGALNARWRSAFKSFDEIEIPSRPERCAVMGAFIDPLANQKLIDHVQFHSELVADAILQISKAIKAESKNKLLCGTYYGYINHVLSKYRYQSIGHFALNKLLDSPYIDFLMSPSSYADRQIGGGSGHMTAFSSFRLHGKLWIDQADLRTLHAAGWQRAADLSDSKAVLQRHFAVNLIKGITTEWYDFSAGWMSSDKRFMDLIGKMFQIETAVSVIPRKTHSAEKSIAVITDEKSTYYTACASDIHLDVVGRQYTELCRTGAGFDMYILDDLEKIPDYKCYLFLNTFRITQAQCGYIANKLRKDKKTLIFVYAPGYTDESSNSTDNLTAITGIKMGVSDAPLPLKVSLADSKNEMLKYVKMPASYGSASAYTPVFYPEDGEVVGMLDGIGKPGLVVKRDADGTVVYSSAPVLPAALLKGIIEQAGVVLSNPFEGDMTYAGDKMVAVHTLSGGKRSIRFTRGCARVKELFTDTSYKLRDGVLEIELAPKSTYLFLEK